MASRTTSQIEPDLDWCHTTINDVSRTFALTVHELEKPLSDELCVGYLLCRVADTIEDASHIPPYEQTKLLNSFSNALTPEENTTITDFMDDVEQWVPDNPDADWELVTETPRVVATFNELHEASQEEIVLTVQEMTDGMSEFIDRYVDEEGLRVQTMVELKEYSWYVAGTVGVLITALLTRDTEDEKYEYLYDLSSSFGLLLQLVNVAKDVHVDYVDENNVYIPEEVLAEYGLEFGDIGDPGKAEAFEPVIRDLVQEAKQEIDDVLELLETMPTIRGNTLSAWAMPFLLAVGTIRELEDRPEDVFSEEGVKVSREEVFTLLGVFNSESSLSITQLYDQVKAQPFTDPSLV